MRAAFLTKVVIIGFQLYSLISAKDADCVLKTTVSEADCQITITGTSNTCCYSTYAPNGKEQCITADNSTPQTLLSSIETIKASMPLTSTSKTVKCGKNAEVCLNIPSPTGFLSCNITLLDYPFSCCYLQTSTVKRCYPVNARFNTTVASDAERIKALYKYTETPTIVCSTVDLPYPLSSSSIQLNYLKLIIVTILMLLL